MKNIKMWLLPIPIDRNPLADMNGGHCGVGKVLYLFSSLHLPTKAQWSGHAIFHQEPRLEGKIWWFIFHQTPDVPEALVQGKEMIHSHL
jgi:hypothetical protein